MGIFTTLLNVITNKEATKILHNNIGFVTVHYSVIYQLLVIDTNDQILAD